MKKYTTILKWLSIPLAIGTTIPLLFSLTSCSSTDVFTAQSYASGNNTIESLTIDVIDREVTIIPSTDNEIKINYFTSDKEFYNLTTTESNGLVMQYAHNKEWTDYVGVLAPLEYRKINVEVPTNVLSDLTISTTNDNINISSISVSNSITLTNEGGDIGFSEIGVGSNLILTAKNGNINGSILGSYDLFSIFCEIKKGQTNLPIEKTDGTKQLKVNCNNGDVDVIFQV